MPIILRNHGIAQRCEVSLQPGTMAVRDLVSAGGQSGDVRFSSGHRNGPAIINDC